MIKMVVVLVALVVVLNFWTPEPDGRYSNRLGTFTFQELNFKNRDFKNCKAKFHLFTGENGHNSVLYRLCPVKYWQICNYRRCFFTEKYQLPYARWDSIQSRCHRGNHPTGYQDF